MRKRICLAQNKDELHDLGSEDLLSRFSDDFLVSILLYLPLKDATVTSMVSRRWRYLWCERARLDFEDKDRSNKIRMGVLFHTKDFKKYFDAVLEERNKYINWVNHVIREIKSPPAIDEFKICFSLDRTAKGAIDKWIEFAISKNVHTLELDLLDGLSVVNKGNYAFPYEIFDRKCESSLKRSSSVTSMEIKFLKALILKRVDVNDEGLNKILSNCPVLEHLSIDHSRTLVKPKIHGKGLALKNLEVIDCLDFESIQIFDSNIVSINCRVDFNFVGPPFTLRLDTLQKLEKISIHDYRMNITRVFRQISCCCIPYLQVLELSLGNLRPWVDMQLFLFSKLPKLKHLIVKVKLWGEGSLSVLTSLVEACPNLERFTIESTRSLLINTETRQAAKQPHEHLEVVEIGNYRGQTGDLDLVMYFIENSVALKKLVIKPCIAANQTTEEEEEENGAKYRAQQQLEPNTPVGVELVIL